MDFTALYEEERARRKSKHNKVGHVRGKSHPALVLGPSIPEKASKKKDSSAKLDRSSNPASDGEAEGNKHGSAQKSTKKQKKSRESKPRKKVPKNDHEGFFREWSCSSPKRSGGKLTLKIKQNSAMGHGGLVWDCSLVLARFLETGFDHKFWKGKNVLELGAGTGLVGLTAAVLGASKVVLSDLEEITPLLDDNTRINSNLTKKCDVNVVDFCWGSTDPRVLMTDHRRASWRERKETFLRRISISHRSKVDLSLGSMDIRRSLRKSASMKGSHLRLKDSMSSVGPFTYDEDGKRYFDVIVASDVAYDPTAFEPLREVLHDLCGPETIVLLSHEWREAHQENTFFRTLKPDFFCEMVPVGDIDPDYRAEDISIFRIRRLAL